MSTPLLQSEIAGYPVRRGKVRDVYDLGDRLVIVATDRISAFDYVLPSGIPDKGRILTQLTQFWLDFLKTPNHLLSADITAMPPTFASQAKLLARRSMLVRKANVVPFECVVRGYLAGSGWKEYRKQGTVCGIPLPAGLQDCQRLPEPIFTPSTKAGTREVAAHDALDREDCGLLHEHEAAGEILGCRRELGRQVVHIGGDQVIGHHVGQKVEPEQRDLGEDFALERDRLGEHDVEGGEAVGSDQQELVA
jgi:phosphoribosylaminoimidazole-succinocarboxamide synthase